MEQPIAASDVPELRPPVLVGRDAELSDMDAFFAAATPALLITGEAGIGKTALWSVAVESAQIQGWRVLTAQPARSELELPFAALGDLLGGALTRVADQVPAPQRQALEVALLLREPEGAPPDQRAIALGTLGVLRALAAEAPTIVAIDDSQWLDAATAAALDFALRRLRADRVRTLLTCRTESLVTGLPLGLAAARTQRIDLGPLPPAAISQLLTSAYRSPVSHPVAYRLHDLAHGNPLHALELGRALDGNWPWSSATLVPPRDLAELVRGRLARLPPSTQDALLFIAAMSRPTLDLLHAACTADVDVDVNRAVDAGLLTVDGTRIRFVHPLYAAACYRAATSLRRGQVHSRLAAVVSDVERRARHLALADRAPSADVAAALEAGARQARARAAPQAAAELAEHARAATPADDLPNRIARTRALARYLLEAGHSARARRTLEELVVESPHGPQRARALVALTTVLFEEDGLGAVRAAADEALREAAGDPAALAEAHLALAERAQLPAYESLQHADRALCALDADPAADAGLLARALREVALGRYHLGRGMPRDLIERAAAIEEALDEPPPIAWRARTCLGECVKYLDCFGESDEILRRSEEAARRTGDISSLADIAGHRAELALWLGRWAEAETHAGQAVDMAMLSEQRGRIALASYFRSLVYAHLGRVEPARDDGLGALHSAQRTGDTWAAMLAGSALGFLALSVGEAEEAAARLAVVDQLASDAGVMTVPRQWRYLGDYVESLVTVGEVDRACDKLAQLRSWAAGMGTGWTAAVSARAAAAVAEATGDRDAALREVAAALTAHEALPLPFERARTLLAAGAIARRARMRRDARAHLEAAAQLFTELGAPHWADRARAELARVSGRTPEAADLTASERRVADLVAEGLSNKQVAAALVVTPRTVEAHLTRIYAKLGLRSRVELARRHSRAIL